MKKFWAFVREREAIRLRREAGRSAPWTTDVTLRDHSFSNVKRSDDPDNVRSVALLEAGRGRPVDFLIRAYAIRSLNRLETFEKYGVPVSSKSLGVAAFIARLDAATARGESIGARQHLTFWAHARLALQRIDASLATAVHGAQSGIDAIRILAAHKPTLYVGPYLGTLIVRDLAFSSWGGAFGPETQVPVANGARVGLEIAAGLGATAGHALLAENGTPGRRTRSLRAGLAPEVLARVAHLSKESHARLGFHLTFIDVENCLCEYSRYARIASGMDGPWRRRITRPATVQKIHSRRS